MSFNHAVVWIDHKEAHVIHFNAEASDTEIIKTRSKHLHLHHHRGTLGSGNVLSDDPYLHEVVKAIADAKEILVVGPGSAKMKLIRHIHGHDADVSGKIVGVETVDHPTDPQLIAFAKKYFVRVDRLRGDNF